MIVSRWCYRKAEALGSVMMSPQWGASDALASFVIGRYKRFVDFRSLEITVSCLWL